MRAVKTCVQVVVSGCSRALLEAAMDRLGERCRPSETGRAVSSLRDRTTRVFGSVARGEDGPGSDVDLLYELAQGRSLGWEIEDLSQDLADLFGRPVDLVSRKALHPLIRDQVLADAEPLSTSW